ncbi:MULTISPECIES: hypothetical protein [Bacteria]|uniref:hypothetical protein n=1 Tax=Bacteria TaxID=2 RepID=UPI003F2B7727
MNGLSGEFSEEITNEELKNGYNQFCVNNKFSDISINKLLENLEDETKQHIISSFYKGRGIYYSSKDNKDEIIREHGYDIIENEDSIIVINPICRKGIFDGKIDTLQEIIKNTESFLLSMYKYNKTLKAFSEILQKGKFEVLEQYSSSNVLEYISNKFNNYTEKGNSYIGHMDTKSKLDYFPTNFQFQYGSLQFVMPLSLNSNIKGSTKKWVEKYCGNIVTGTMSDINKVQEQKLYRKLVNMGRFDIINDCFFGESAVYSSNRIVIADLFAGEGEWLSLYKKMINNRNAYIIANEIEENRFEKIKEKKFNMITNKGYEELVEIPEECINICLFNPPYGEVEGVRNVKRFFDMMIEDNYLEKGECRVIFALREDDTMAILDDIVKYFNINVESVFRHNGNEYDKLKQICFVASRREVNLDLNLRSFQSEARRVKEYFEKAIKRTYEELTLENNKGFYKALPLYGNDIYLKLDNLKVKTNPELYLSDLNEVWSKIEQSLTIETFSGKTVKLPNEPDTFGAIANLISSGLINGEIDGEHPHCLAAGITECTSNTIDDEGNIVTTKKMLPFCSILSGGEIIEVASGKEESDVIIKGDGQVVQV